jgi:hypothetical protein
MCPVLGNYQEVTTNKEIQMSKIAKSIMNKKYDKSHGSPFDRGTADSYYGRPKDPHYWPEGTGKGKKVTDLSQEEHDAYHAGYDWNEEHGDKKEWE